MDNHIRLEFISLSQNEALARTVTAAFVSSLDPTIEEIADIRTAVSEAVTNAIVHGYKNTFGIITLECMLEERLLTVRISDNGRGILNIEQAMQPFFTTDAEHERTGMGFAVMNAFMDSLDVKSQIGAGTVVTMKKMLSSNDENIG